MKLTLTNLCKQYKQKTHLPLSDFADTQDPPVQAVLSILAFFCPEEDDIVSWSVTVEALVVSMVACVFDSFIYCFDVEVVLLVEVSLAVVGGTVTSAETCSGKII